MITERDISKSITPPLLKMYLASCWSGRVKHPAQQWDYINTNTKAKHNKKTVRGKQAWHARQANVWIGAAGTLLHFTFHLTSFWKHGLLQIHHSSISTEADPHNEHFLHPHWSFSFLEWKGVEKKINVSSRRWKRTQSGNSMWQISPNCVRVVHTLAITTTTKA